MAKPTLVPTWATNATYASSSQPWSGGLTKVQPASGVQAEGHNPEDPMVAQYENWWKNLTGQWAQYQSDQSIKVRGINPMNAHVSSGTWTFDGLSLTCTATGSVDIILPIESGERITSISIAAFGNGTTDGTYLLQFVNHNQSSVTTLVNVQQDVNRAAAWGLFTPAITPMTVGSLGGSMVLNVLTNGSGYSIGSITYTVDRV